MGRVVGLVRARTPTRLRAKSKRDEGESVQRDVPRHLEPPAARRQDRNDVLVLGLRLRTSIGHEEAQEKGAGTSETDVATIARSGDRAYRAASSPRGRRSKVTCENTSKGVTMLGPDPLSSRAGPTGSGFSCGPRSRAKSATPTIKAPSVRRGVLTQTFSVRFCNRRLYSR